MSIMMFVDSIRFATILLFGSAGETITEKSGHLNLGTPGVMCMGAMGGALGGFLYINAIGDAHNANPFLAIFIPVLFCLLLAGLTGALFSFITVTLRCNQNVTGLVITTLCVGLYPFVISVLDYDVIDQISTIASNYYSYVIPPSVSGANWFTQLFLSHGFLVYLSIIIAVLIAVIMKHTRIGLFLRTVGENPSAADAAGINVSAYRYVATIIGCAVSGLGGLYFLYDWLAGAFEFVVDSYGWLAVSLVIFTMWRTEIGIAGSFFFAFLYILPKYMSVTGPDKKLVELIPYLATILILVLTSILNKKENQAPAGLGVSYFREDR